MDLVSVIIPCFNGGKTILKTISSIKNQSWENFEIIVVNDGSNERNTIKILKKIKGIKLFHQKNLGLPSARNYGISKAKGKFILPLDDDDWIEKNTIELMVQAIEKMDNSHFVYSDITLEGELKGVVSKNYNFFDQLFLNHLPYCILYKKKLWTEVGRYDEKMKDGFEDWEFNIRLGFNGIYGVRISRPLFHYNVSRMGMLRSKSSKMYSQIWLQIQKKHKSIYTISILLNIWKKWRKEKSNYPAFLYFILFLSHKILPKNIFNLLFRLLFNLKNSRTIFN